MGVSSAGFVLITRFTRVLTRHKHSTRYDIMILVALTAVGIISTLFVVLKHNAVLSNLTEIFYDSNFWSEVEMTKVLDEERSRIRVSLENVSFPQDSPFRSLEEFLPERGGKQLIFLIIGYWRSGSTFLGDTLSSHPSTLYFYEPFKKWGAQQIRAPPESEEAVRVLRKLIENDFCNLDSILRFERSRNPYVRGKNAHMSRICKKYGGRCYEPEFLSRFMKLFPFKVFKITRLRLSQVEYFLKNPRYNVRVILLVRDPRGLMSSRRRLFWCSKGPDCYEPRNFCSDLVSDHATALRFSEMLPYPERFKVVRYEDLALSPEETIKDLFNFAGLHLHKQVSDFILTHTRFSTGSVYTTFRNATANAFRWRENTPVELILDTQMKCKTALELWGYKQVKDFTTIKTFFPIDLNFTMTK